MNAVLLAAVATAGCGLAAGFGPVPAWFTCTAVAVVAGAAGVVPRRTSGDGRVTWRRHLAGCQIPWE